MEITKEKISSRLRIYKIGKENVFFFKRERESERVSEEKQ